MSVSVGKKIAFLVVLSFWLAPKAHATTTTLNFNSQGWVNSTGFGNGASNPNNAFTGNSGGARYNSWANFDLSSVIGPVVSARLQVYTVGYPPGASTPYELGIYDVNTSFQDLEDGIGGVLAYNDLGTGNRYASAIFGDGTTLTLTLSGQALADLNASPDGTFRVGFTNITLNSLPVAGPDFGLLTFTSVLILDDTPTEVPEPSTIVLVGTGLLALVGIHRRRSGLMDGHKTLV